MSVGGIQGPGGLGFDWEILSRAVSEDPEARASAAIAAIDEAARENPTGPEAIFCRRVRSLGERARLEIEEAGGDRHRIDQVLRNFELNLQFATLDLNDALSAEGRRSALDVFVAGLPSLFRRAIESRGLPLPGGLALDVDVGLAQSRLLVRVKGTW